MTDKVRDLRVKEKYFIDDIYLNGYAKHCGIFATAVYNAICRHAGREQTAFPSIELMAKKLKISCSSVKRGVKKLEEFNIIRATRRKNKKGWHKVNTYILLDKSVWKPIQRSERTLENDNPQVRETETRGQTDQNQRSEGADKVTHIKDTQYKVTQSEEDRDYSFAEKIATQLHGLMLKNNPKARIKSNWLANWSVEVDRMIQQDKRSKDEIVKVLLWCQQDEFWKTNILSMGKMREKFDQLFMKMKSSNGKGYSPASDWSNQQIGEVEL